MKIRPAARQAAQDLGLEGDLDSHEERLRKLYRALRKKGALPGALPASTVESAAEELRQYSRAAYAGREERRRQLGEELVAKEREAEALGLDISERDLLPLLGRLRTEKEQLDTFIFGGVDFAIGTLMEKGLSADQAEAEIETRAARFPQVKEELEVVKRIWKLREMLPPS